MARPSPRFFHHRFASQRTMKHNLPITALFVACIALTGCSSTGQKAESNPSPTTASPAPAPSSAPAASGVRIPAASMAKLVVNMSGTKVSTDAKDWDSFKKEWRDIFQDQAAKAGVPFEWQEGEPRPMGQPGTLLSVHVNDYRYVGTGARIFFGIMTGNAYIDAQARFTDLSSGAMLGEQPYKTSSSAGHGIFASMTPKQIYGIADDVIAKFKAR